MSRPGGDEELPRDVLRHLLGVVKAISHQVNELAAEFDLSLPQYNALKNLETPCSQRELAQELHYDASNVTDIVDRLEERGLVTRTIDPNDRRVRRLVLTPEGEAIRRKLFERAIAEAPLHALTPGEQAKLCELLGKIAEPVELPI
jgi:DNA-binding MarR family transcriptional regulator